MATAARTTVMGTSAKIADPRDSYHAEPPGAVRTSNQASSANIVAVAPAANGR
jgi:hypothetical protein